MGMMYRMALPIEFPSGVCAGGSSVGNEIVLERNGKNQPVLRGSTIAGRLRHALMSLPVTLYDSPDINKIFGYSPSGREDDIVAGCLIVEDVVLEQGKGNAGFRICHLRDRHKGRVVDKGLFAIEMCPPGTRADLVLWLAWESCEQVPRFANFIRALLEQGVVFGGNGNRGVGLARLRHPDIPICHAYKLNDPEDYAAWLDARDGCVEKNGAREIPGLSIPKTGLCISLEFSIPEGQDILVGQGGSETRQAEPALTIGYDGKPYWEIPGSAFHGLLRQWVTRLAARDGYHVADTTERYDPMAETDGDLIGWCFDPKNYKAHEECVVSRLFGSLHKAGRVHCTGAYSLAGEVPKEDMKQYAGIQERTHVAIDPVSGGAVNHMLFKTAVLTSDYKGTFKTDWYIEAPTEEEARWIGRTIAAMDMGLVRIGSSKASGRLKLIKPLNAKGMYAEVITGMGLGGGND